MPQTARGFIPCDQLSASRDSRSDWQQHWWAQAPLIFQFVQMIVIGIILGVLYINMDKSFRVRPHSPPPSFPRAHSQARPAAPPHDKAGVCSSLISARTSCRISALLKSNLEATD